MSENKQLKQARTAFSILCKTLDADGWRYDKDEEQMSIECGAQGEDLPIPVTISVDAEKALVTFISPLPFIPAEDRRREMAVAVSQANNGLADGSFDYDFASGRLLFRLTVSIRESLISEAAFRYMIYCACVTVDKYNDRFLMVAKSTMDCDEVAQFIS